MTCGRNPNEVEDLLAGRGLGERICPEDGLRPGEHGWQGSLFAEARNDPYLNLVLHHVANAWVDGYEQALHDENLGGVAQRRELLDRAHERLAELGKREAEALVALAQLGRPVDGRRLL